MTIQLAKGVKDYTFKEMIKREDLVKKLKVVFERYGFSPFETPIIERYDVLTSKFGAGEDSDAASEIFKLKDQGERELGLRFELTLSMCRFVAMNPTIKLPFKRYEIGRVYRDGPIKLGRMREFIQCDVDIVGSKNMTADAEILLLGLDALKELGLDAYIIVNNRKILRGIMASCDVEEEKKNRAIIIIDKLSKIGPEGVQEELKNIGIKEEQTKKLLNIISTEKSFEETIKTLKENITDEEGKQGIQEIQELFSYLTEEDKQNIKFNVSLARGLGYYTGTIFEGYLRKSKVKSAICGGGRYDDLISKLMNTNNPYPAIGISFGTVPILEAINLEETETEKEVVTELFIIPIGNVQKEAMNIAKETRTKGIPTDIDIMNRALNKNLKYANSLNIPYVLFVGEDEIKNKTYKLRDMKTGEEQNLNVEEIIKKIKK